MPKAAAQKAAARKAAAQKTAAKEAALNIGAESGGAPKIYTNELSPLFDRCITRPSVPLGIIGDPGSGKTEMLEAWSASRGLAMVKLLASSMDETDIAGIVTKDADGKNAVLLSPQWIRKLGGRGVLFLDELNTARKEVQDTLLTLIASRHLPNGDRLGDGVLIVAAQNDAHQCGNYEQSPAMRSRFMWVRHTLSIRRWSDWALGIVPVPEPIPGASASALLPYQTRAQWHRWFCSRPENSADKKSLVQQAVDLGLKFDQGDDYIDKDCSTCGRSLLNLLYWTQNAAEMIEWAPAFIDETAAEVFRSAHFTACRNVANAVFENGREQTVSGNAEEDAVEEARIQARRPTLRRIQEAVSAVR